MFISISIRVRLVMIRGLYKGLSCLCTVSCSRTRGSLSGVCLVFISISGCRVWRSLGRLSCVYQGLYKGSSCFDTGSLKGVVLRLYGFLCGSLFKGLSCVAVSCVAVLYL